ncbi:MAG: SusC/RagA family TonB-linked outer membrane protein [Tunicatimonas sp.]
MNYFTRMKGFWLAASLMLLTGVLYAQEKTVTGNVSSDAEGALPGVNVLLKGTSTGTVTDLDGNYRLSVPEAGGTLVFTSIGYASQEVEIGNQSTIDIGLAEDIKALDEIVVIGYGTQEKKEITSAVTSVKAEDFNGGNVNNPSQLIQGKVAGLVIARPGGDPTGNFNIRLRGTSSATGNTSPLIIIDGVPGADLNSVDPSDIASIDVLKDGSAAAIYGTRATNGVILVTTKSGVTGEPKINYNGYVATDLIANQVDVLNADEYRQLVNDPNFAFSNPNLDLGSSTDWFDEVTQVPISHVHNLALSGGTEKTTYRVALNYRDIEALGKNSGFDQLNSRLNLRQKALDDRLTFDVILGITNRNLSGFDQPDTQFNLGDDGQSNDGNPAFRFATIYNPTAPIFQEDQSFGGFYQAPGAFNYDNPRAIVEQLRFDGIERNITSNFRASFELIEGLNASAFYSAQRDNRQVNFFAPKDAYTVGLNANGRAERFMQEELNQLFEATLNLDRKVGDNSSIEALAGYSYQYLTNEGFFVGAGNFLTNRFTYNNIGASEDLARNINPNFGSGKESSTLIAGFARVNFNYNDLFYVQGVVRREGSSKFGANNEWAWFPAASAGVNIANLTTIPQVDELKFRVGYGITGSLPEQNYVSLPRLTTLGGRFFYNGNYIQPYGPGSNPNPDLKWERKGEINVGVDFSLFNFRINGSVDVYDRTTTDLIYDVPVPVPPNQFPRSLLNLGELNNRGVEVTLDGALVRGEGFNYSMGFNFALNRTELVSLSSDEFDFGDQVLIANLGAPGLNATNLIRVKEGEPLGQIYGPKYVGISDEGRWIFEDLNGDDKIDGNDETVIGNGLPDFTLGLNNTLSYGRWDLNFFLRGSFGHDLVNTFRAFYEVPKVINSYNILKSATEGDVRFLTEDARFSSYHVEDASFLRLDNATLGYNFNVENVDFLSQVRVYVAAQNLFTLTNYTGVDSEVRFDDNGDNLAPGIERRNTYFLNRTFTVGLNVAL